jgi:DNA helicase-2/ATP-dependent DNA helicase PcrA
LDELQAPFSGEHRLFRLLHAVFFNLNPLDLAVLAATSTLGSRDNNPDPLYAQGVQRQKQPRFYWRQWLSDPENLQQLPLKNTAHLLEIGQRLNQWVADTTNLGLPALIERLYSQTGLLDWALQQPDKIWYLQVLHGFLDAVPTPEKLRPGQRQQPGFMLQHFLEMLDSMERNALSLPLRQQVETVNGVQLLTAHAAKGLEFEHVFLFDCVEEAWEKSSGDKRHQFLLPPTLTLSGEEDALEARRRLFYVALTRAKRGLYVSYAQQGADGKNLLQSQFVEETQLTAQSPDVPAAQVYDTQSLLLLEAEKPVLVLPENAMVEALLGQFTLSVTALNRYLRCPIAFWYEDILRVPGTISEAAAYGIAMHGALQRFFLKMKSDKQYQWPSSEALSKLFLVEMEHLRLHFSEHGLVQRQALGKEYLRRIHVEQIPYWRKRAIVERRIDKVTYQGVPLTGVLDKLEWLENGKLRIVDYKTGAPDLKKIAPPGDQQPLGGEYWRQLAFYQILLENARIYPESVEKSAIFWLEPDKKGSFPAVDVTFSNDEIAFVGQLIQETFAHIQQRQFTTGCGQDDCTWCTMLRDRTTTAAMPRIQEEGLDDITH